MLVQDSKGREVEISVYGRYDDDIQIDEAVYVDGDEEVPEEEIEYISETYADEIYQEWTENQACAAEAYYDSLQDR